MAGYWNQNPFTNSDFIFRCQFLGMKDIRSDDLCHVALKELKALAGSFWLGRKETHCKLCIGHAFVIIEEEETGFIVQKSVTTEISLIIQDPDDQTVFGYMHGLRSFLRPTFGAFKSEEAEVIVKTLREYTGLTNNIMGEMAGSLDGNRGLFQNLTHHLVPPQEKEKKEANLSMVKENRSRRTSRSMRASRQTREQELVNWSEKTDEMTQQFPNFQNQLQRKDNKGSTLERKLQQLQNEVSISRRQQVEQCLELDEVRRQKASVETQVRQMEQQQLRERDQVEAQNQRLREMERQLAQRGESSYDWIISRNEVQVTNKRLGSGGWGTVYEGRYCGCDVAVKQIHEDFASAHRLKMFQREIDMASKCRHPCLLQFIGATIDEGFPLLVTELMETSLRRLLKERPLSTGEVSIISLDVARALNYLHQKRPVPMIHRDISSANVLLWRKAGRETGIHEAQWRGKVSDYGTAKFVEQVMTQTPGCLAYSAPEARTTTQTAKIDVYSFGILLCEMCIREDPEPDRRDEQVDKMSNQALQEFVRQCLQTNPDDRPDMTEIIHKLEQFQ